VPLSSRTVESNSNPAHTIQCCNCLLCVKGKVKETVLMPHAYLLYSFCLSNSDKNSYLQTWRTPHLSHGSEHRTFLCSLLRAWQTLLHMCPHGSAASQICKQPPSGTLWKSAALETLVNTEGCTWHLNVRCVSKASCFCSASLIFGHILLLLVKLSILPVAIQQQQPTKSTFHWQIRHISSWGVIYSQKWRDLCFPYRVKPLLHATI
jgi:hypothetical protein